MARRSRERLHPPERNNAPRQEESGLDKGREKVSGYFDWGKRHVEDIGHTPSIEEGEVSNAQLSKEWMIEGHKVAISLVE